VLLWKQKIFVLGVYVGGEFIASILIGVSSELTWLFGNIVFPAIHKVLVKVFKKVMALKKLRVWKKVKQYIKTSSIMKSVNRKKMEKLIIGMCVVATVFGK